MPGTLERPAADAFFLDPDFAVKELESTAYRCAS